MEDKTAGRGTGQVIPSEEEAIALHRRFGSDERIVAHCKAVARVAVLLGNEFARRGVKVDVGAVRAAALLHDIGRSRVQTVMHGVEGAEMIAREGVDMKVVEMVRRHVGAGISPDEAMRLRLPKFDYIPRTLEERIVCFSDKMVDSDIVRPFDEEVRRFAMKSHDVTRLLALKRRLQEELGEDPEEFVLKNIKESQTEARA
jgi:uncharacterized protein (TIGR00295 family)